MSDTVPTDEAALRARMHQEMADSLDEELELEIDDDRLEALVGDAPDRSGRPSLDRKVYFRESLRLQSELVKFQDWVQHEKKKVVVLFEGRDSAGKGGAIKRITQRLNPRVCRVAALPAPNERERTQRYFSAMRRTFRPVEKSCCSIAAGTIAPASNGSWVSATRSSIRSFSNRCLNSSAC